MNFEPLLLKYGEDFTVKKVSSTSVSNSRYRDSSENYTSEIISAISVSVKPHRRIYKEGYYDVDVVDLYVKSGVNLQIEDLVIINGREYEVKAVQNWGAISRVEVYRK